MGGRGWAYVLVDGYGMGMGTNSKENVGLCCQPLCGNIIGVRIGSLSL